MDKVREPPRSNGEARPALRGLELSGFKSFATRTRFDFCGELTVLVGPNGSGKSNVADAVRWVLAEPAGRGLRARKSEDLLFAGGGARPPAGYAEATLLLDNTARLIPLDADEVAVTRRLHRSGESEYWLNGARVRQREVVEALARLGIVQSSYAVIGQGLIDAALSLRPEERRELIEEAADVRRHHLALEDARARLAATRANLQRLDDLLRDLKPRVEKLAQRAAEAEEHRRLTHELAESLALSYAARWRAAQARATAAMRAADAARRQHESARARLQEAADQLAACRSEVNALRQRHDTLLHDLRNAESAADRARYEFASSMREIERRSEELDRLSEEAEEAERRAAREEAALDAARQECVRLQTAIEEFEQQSRSHPDEQLAEQALEEARQTVFDRRAERAALESERSTLLALAERVATELASLEAEGDAPAWDHELAKRAEEAQRRAAEVAERLERAEAEWRSLRDWLGEAEERLAATRVEIAALGERLRETERRLAHLANEEAAGEGYPPAVRAVLERAGRRFAGHGGRRPVAEARLTGILGTVADLISVPAGYDLAFEAALGGRSHDLVVERWAEAEAAIRYLRELGIGRATFLPLDTIQPGRRASWPPEAGVHGVAADLCRSDPRFRPIVDRLLGNVIVVEDLTVARRCLTRNGRGHVFVTLLGETVGSWGAVSGGSRPSRGDAVWRRRHDLATWTAERETVANRLEEGRQRAAMLAAEIAAGRARLKGLSADIATLERSRTEAQRDHAHLHARQERQSLAEEEAARRRERISVRRAALLAEQAGLADRRVAVELALTNVAEQLAAAERERAATEVAADAARQRARAEAGHLARLRAAQQHAGDAIRRLQAALERERETAARARRRRESLASEVEAARNDASRHQALAAAATARAEALSAQARDLAERRRTLDADLDRLARREQTEREAVAAAVERLGEARREREAAADALEHVRARMASDGVEPDHVALLPVHDLDTEELERRITRLRARLRSIPSGGYAVIAEYQEERARLLDCTTQVEDLRAAEANLTRTIASLEKLIAERFDQTVAAVNIEFRRYFRRLFGGGTARLGVGDDSGIEIEAHPPGKRAHNLAALSGGERALTAAALVFALLRVNPLPFCVLDEVDAALDESNVRRFVEALQELAATTQFVVITHNQVTMEAAAAVYGLAVGSDGSTKVVSVQLRQASSRASQAAG